MSPALGVVALVVLVCLASCAATDDSGGAAPFRPAAIDPDPLWDFGDPAASEARFRAEAERAPDGASLLWRTQEARAMGLAGDYDRARVLLAQVERGLAGELSEAHVRVALERGRVENSAGARTSAMPLFRRAWEVARGLRLDGLAVDAAHMLAIAAESEEALEWNGVALELAEASADPAASRWTASLLNNQGWFLHDRGDFEGALDHFERGVVEREALGDAGRTRMAHWAVARCLRSLGRLEEALAIQERLARELVAAGETDGFVEQELGEIKLALGREVEAQAHLARAGELFAE